jgi:hypothetical protein
VLKVVLFGITQLYVISSNIKKINSLLVGINTCFKRVFKEKDQGYFQEKTFTTSCKLAGDKPKNYLDPLGCIKNRVVGV